MLHKECQLQRALVSPDAGPSSALTARLAMPVVSGAGCWRGQIGGAWFPISQNHPHNVPLWFLGKNQTMKTKQGDLAIQYRLLRDV
jgi:hypothetical protein